MEVYTGEEPKNRHQKVDGWYVQSLFNISACHLFATVLDESKTNRFSMSTRVFATTFLQKKHLISAKLKTLMHATTQNVAREAMAVVDVFAKRGGKPEQMEKELDTIFTESVSKMMVPGDGNGDSDEGATFHHKDAMFDAIIDWSEAGLLDTVPRFAVLMDEFRGHEKTAAYAAHARHLAASLACTIEQELDTAHQLKGVLDCIFTGLVTTQALMEDDDGVLMCEYELFKWLRVALPVLEAMTIASQGTARGEGTNA